MKKMLVLTTCIAALFGCSLFTSCEPDEVDAFAEGYRQGYYGNYKSVQTPSAEPVEVADETGALTVE